MWKTKTTNTTKDLDLAVMRMSTSTSRSRRMSTKATVTNTNTRTRTLTPLTKTKTIGGSFSSSRCRTNSTPLPLLPLPLVACRSYQQGTMFPSDTGAGSGSGMIQEVEWQKENANAVTLIGNLGREPEMKYLEDGKVIANVSIAVSRGRNAAPHWFDLDFWNDEARQVESLVKGQQIQVTGRLTQNTWKDKMTGQTREKVRVVVSSVALVTSNAMGGMGGGGGGQWDQGGDSYRPQQKSSSFYGGGGGGGRSQSVQAKDIEAKWAALFCMPSDFWDNRASKKNPKAPDFKHKETGEALWIQSRNTPSWVASSLKELDMNKQVYINSLFSDGSNSRNGGGSGNSEEIPF